jgi:protein-L-isoaspartate(D-aspartate) O-methyltransferase
MMDRVTRMIRDIEAETRYTRALIGKDRLNEDVIEAIRCVPREEFVPKEVRLHAHDNGPLPIGHGQTISQPYIVALMTDLLEPKRDGVVLEVGTGCGYQAAVLSLLVRQVYSIEIVEPLAEKARARLNRLGYNNVEVRVGDAYDGWEEHAPYDGIIVTAAAPHIPPPLIDQVRAGGQLVIPVGFPHSFQELVLLKKDLQGKICRRNILGVSFVPLTGEHDKLA